MTTKKTEKKKRRGNRRALLTGQTRLKVQRKRREDCPVCNFIGPLPQQLEMAEGRSPTGTIEKREGQGERIASRMSQSEERKKRNKKRITGGWTSGRALFDAREGIEEAPYGRHYRAPLGQGGRPSFLGRCLDRCGLFVQHACGGLLVHRLRPCHVFAQVAAVEEHVLQGGFLLLRLGGSGSLLILRMQLLLKGFQSLH